MQNKMSQLGVFMTFLLLPSGCFRMSGDTFGGHSYRDVTGTQWMETYYAQNSPMKQRIIQSKCQPR